MPACCCKSCKTNKSMVSCLGRCDLPKHRCLEKAEVKPGPVPRHMGWLYTAIDAPEHQLRCGWRPGHIYCPVLRKIEQNHCYQQQACCSSMSARGPVKSCFPPKCVELYPTATDMDKSTCGDPYIRIVRHAGQYTICTKPSNIDNHPSGPYPLKYVLNTDDTDDGKDGKYSIEAKFNDYQFDYTSSQASFVVDFTPPSLASCCKPKCAKSLSCVPC